MRKPKIALGLVLALVVGACAGDVTASDEYQALEQQLSDTRAELSLAQAATRPEAPVEVLALLDEWWASNERGDGSVADLYTASGYHLYGDERIPRDTLAAHLAVAVNPEWITEPYLIIADETRGRYVVTRGIYVAGTTSALTFEILTTTDAGLRIAQSDWTDTH